MGNKKNNKYYPPESDEMYRDKYKPKLIIEKAKAFRINPRAKYLLIFHRQDNTKGDLTYLDRALKEFFNGAVLAIFADEITDVKLAELVEEEDNK